MTFSCLSRPLRYKLVRCLNHTDILLLLYFCFTFVHDKIFIVLHNVNILRKLVHPVTGQEGDWEDLFLFCFSAFECLFCSARHLLNQKNIVKKNEILFKITVFCVNMFIF